MSLSTLPPAAVKNKLLVFFKVWSKFYCSSNMPCQALVPAFGTKLSPTLPPILPDFL